MASLSLQLWAPNEPKKQQKVERKTSDTEHLLKSSIVYFCLFFFEYFLLSARRTGVAVRTS